MNDFERLVAYEITGYYHFGADTVTVFAATEAAAVAEWKRVWEVEQRVNRGFPHRYQPVPKHYRVRRA